MRRLSIFKVGLIYISHSLKLCRVQESSLLTSAMIGAKAGEAYRVEMTSPRSHSSLEENGTSHSSGVWIQPIPSPFGLDISPCSLYRLPLPQKKAQILLNRSMSCPRTLPPSTHRVPVCPSAIWGCWHLVHNKIGTFHQGFREKPQKTS